MTTGQHSRVGTASEGLRWYSLALFAALLSLLVALAVAGAGTASAAEGAVGTVSGGDSSGGGGAVPSITAISLIPATSRALAGAGAAVQSAESVQVSLIPATSRALAAAAHTRAAAVQNAAFDDVQPGIGGDGVSDRPGAGWWLLITLALGGAAAVVVVARNRRLRVH